jgi:spermidine synthase
MRQPLRAEVVKKRNTNRWRTCSRAILIRGFSWGQMLRLARLAFWGIVFYTCASAHAQVVTIAPRVRPKEFFLAFCAVVLVGIIANAFLVGLVRPGAAPPKWQQNLEFSPYALGGFSWRNLALWSFLSLFLELLMIRWISSEIRIFAYFKNFVLIACFLGFGLGCYLSRRKTNLLLMLVPLVVLTALIRLPWPALRLMISQLPTFIGASAGVQVWGVPSVLTLPTLAMAAAVIVPIFGLVAFSFVPMGQLVGWYLENASEGTLAYSVNVFAALCGIILYTVLCFLSQPPATWLMVGGLIIMFLLWGNPRLRWASLATLLFCIALLKISPPKDTRVYWSPYQKLTLGAWGINGQILGYVLNTNDSWYQQILDLSPQFVQSHPWIFQEVPIEWNAYNIPYRFSPRPSAVLILGSGMGNDVAAALRNGASEVTAVEIDPLILKLGKEFHFEKPYDSPHVRQVTDDARSYIENTSDRFDLIMFSLLDSHTTSSYYTNIRIDNYVYTREAFNAAKRLLKKDGVFIVKFQVGTPWIAGRLHSLLSQIFRHAPVQLETDSSSYTTSGRFFVTGSEQRIAQALTNPALATYVERHSHIQMEPASVTTDDWPYFYQKSPGLPMPVVLIPVVLILLCVLLLRDMGMPIRSLRWHFFFLGAGFLLLEAQIISKIALLFGTTWVVNSIVIAGLLVLILGANTLIGFKPSFPATVAYAGLLVTLAVGFLVPVRAIFLASVPARILAATLVLCLPVFFAGIVFIKSFAQASFSPEALGSNLLGAMVGGMVESASLWTGIRSLALLAAVLYVASWITLRAGGSGRQTVPALSSVGAQ